jgi:hypothetical protein
MTNLAGGLSKSIVTAVALFKLSGHGGGVTTSGKNYAYPQQQDKPLLE